MTTEIMRAPKRKEGMVKRECWGGVYYFPCEYVTYLELRVIYKYYWEAVYKAARYCRWMAKDEQNRVGPEPELCDIFKLHPKGREAGYVIDPGFKKDFWSATTPQTDPDKVVPLQVPPDVRYEVYGKLVMRELDEEERPIHIEKAECRPAKSVRVWRSA